MVSDRPSSGTGSTVKFFGIDSQLVSHWQSIDESQVVADWSSSGMGLTVKVVSHWQSNDEIQVVTDWTSSGMGLTVKWSHIGSLMIKVKW